MLVYDIIILYEPYEAYSITRNVLWINTNIMNKSAFSLYAQKEKIHGE